MNDNQGLALVAPRITPALDPRFRPAVLTNRAFRQRAQAVRAKTVRLALEQADGSVSRLEIPILPDSHAEAAGNFICVEREVKFLLWSRGGYRIYVDGPAEIASRLKAHFADSLTGKFDSQIVGERMYDHPIDVAHTSQLPALP